MEQAELIERKRIRKYLNEEKKIKDQTFIMCVIDEYNRAHFNKMYYLIREYDTIKFFTDLFELFNIQHWRNRENAFYTYVGITREFLRELNYITDAIV